jgi:hypothetical protein
MNNGIIPSLAISTSGGLSVQDYPSFLRFKSALETRLADLSANLLSQVLKEEYSARLDLRISIDEEGTIVGFEELYTNNNEPTNSPLGLTKRGTSLRGLSPAGTLGAVIVRNPKYSKEFRVGGGFTLAERDEIWNNQARYLGAQITYKFQEYGTMDVPRQPVFKGFRPKYI